VLAAGDGRWGLEAPWDVFLETAEQRCWWHKVGNVLAALTKSAHPGAKRALAEIYNADNKTLAVRPPTRIHQGHPIRGRVPMPEERYPSRSSESSDGTASTRSEEVPFGPARHGIRCDRYGRATRSRRFRLTDLRVTSR
jgi:hypothetical protein